MPDPTRSRTPKGIRTGFGEMNDYVKDVWAQNKKPPIPKKDGDDEFSQKTGQSGHDHRAKSHRASGQGQNCASHQDEYLCADHRYPNDRDGDNKSRISRQSGASYSRTGEGRRSRTSSNLDYTEGRNRTPKADPNVRAELAEQDKTMAKQIVINTSQNHVILFILKKQRRSSKIEAVEERGANYRRKSGEQTPTDKY